MGHHLAKINSRANGIHHVSEQYNSDFNNNFSSQMAIDILWWLWLQLILLNNELKQILLCKVRIFLCSSDVQKSYCRKNILPAS